VFIFNSDGKISAHFPPFFIVSLAMISSQCAMMKRFERKEERFLYPRGALKERKKNEGARRRGRIAKS
jgi:hypothetical protein